MTTYASAKGRSGAQGAAAKPAAPAAPLTEQQKAQISERRAMVHEHLPDMLPFLADLVEEGLITGWRNVQSVTLIDPENDPQ